MHTYLECNELFPFVWLEDYLILNLQLRVLIHLGCAVVWQDLTEVAVRLEGVGPEIQIKAEIPPVKAFCCRLIQITSGGLVGWGQGRCGTRHHGGIVDSASLGQQQDSGSYHGCLDLLI